MTEHERPEHLRRRVATGPMSEHVLGPGRQVSLEGLCCGAAVRAIAAVAVLCATWINDCTARPAFAVETPALHRQLSPQQLSSLATAAGIGRRPSPASRARRLLQWKT